MKEAMLVLNMNQAQCRECNADLFTVNKSWELPEIELFFKNHMRAHHAAELKLNKGFFTFTIRTHE